MKYRPTSLAIDTRTTVKTWGQFVESNGCGGELILSFFDQFVEEKSQGKKRDNGQGCLFISKKGKDRGEKGTLFFNGKPNKLRVERLWEIVFVSTLSEHAKKKMVREWL